MMSDLRKSWAILALALAAATLATGCGEDQATGPGLKMSNIQGRVEGDAPDGRGPNVEGAEVTVSMMQADGSLSDVSEYVVKANKSGRFHVQTRVDGMRHLVVRATKDGSEWWTVVSSEVRHGSTVACAPLNQETTNEGLIYARVTADGLAGGVSLADVQDAVDADVAANIRSSHISQLASAAEAQADAEARFLSDASVGATAAQLQAVADEKTVAAAALEPRLDSARGNADIVTQAQEDFREALMDAYVEAGLGLDAFARSREIASQALLKETATVSAGLRSALMVSVAGRRAFALDRGVQEAFSVLETSPQIKADVRAAGMDLRADLKVASTPNDITEAFSEYHERILDRLTFAMESESETLIAVDGVLNSVGGASTVLDATVNQASTTEELVSAYVDFFSAVDSEVSASVAGADPSKIDAAASILTMINMQP